MPSHVHYYTKAFLMNNFPIIQLIQIKKYCFKECKYTYDTQKNMYNQRHSCKQRNKIPETKNVNDMKTLKSAFFI